VNLSTSASGLLLPHFFEQGGSTFDGDMIVESASVVAAPTVNKVPIAARYAGLTVPSLPSDPTWAVQNGMIYFDSTNGRLRARIAGTWRTVTLVTP
jgi:hypothetical protein